MSSLLQSSDNALLSFYPTSGHNAIIVKVLTFLFITDDTIKTEEDIEKYLGIIPLTVIPDGNVKYGSYSNYAKGKKD